MPCLRAVWIRLVGLRRLFAPRVLLGIFWMTPARSAMNMTGCGLLLTPLSSLAAMMMVCVAVKAICGRIQVRSPSSEGRSMAATGATPVWVSLAMAKPPCM